MSGKKQKLTAQVVKTFYTILMYCQIIPTFPSLSALQYEELRMYLEEMKQSEGCREHRERYYFNNRKKWCMNLQQLKHYKNARKLEAEISVQQHYGMGADVFMKISNSYYHAQMVNQGL
jgi:hypothetical protein